MSTVPWFRKPSLDQPGTLNACYAVLDLPVAQGRADEELATGRTYARVLTEVAAFAGALRALGLVVGASASTADDDLVARLALARLGVVRRGGGVVVEADRVTKEGEDFPRDLLMQAGRADPASVVDVVADHLVEDGLTHLDAIGTGWPLSGG